MSRVDSSHTCYGGDAGKYRHATVMADQFSVRVKRSGKTFTRVLSVEDGRAAEALRGWAWGMPPAAATCHALFPRAWTVYEVRGLCVRQPPIDQCVGLGLGLALMRWRWKRLVDRDPSCAIRY